MGSWPKDVGIIALESYFPAQFVEQTELEEFDNVSKGKYTIGLGQDRMGFCTDREDINSLCLTVVQKLLDKNHIKPQEIGRLEVGTETIIDKSKSVKTVLMQLFEPYGVTDVEGIDTTNACYGGTAALFNAVSWVESSAWNGRYALVVAGDIAVYAEGAARPTGGAGAIAMLVGPNAPLVFDRGTRATYIRHAYDFYKPDLTSEYPTVDGKLSIQCYLNALDHCYQFYQRNVAKISNTQVTLNYFDSILFHSPYTKLVQKSFARLALNDFIQTPQETRSSLFPGLDTFNNVKLEKTYFDRDVEKAFLAQSKDFFIEKTKPSLLLASEIGNMYTASLYGGLVSLLINKNLSQLAGNKIGLFSYGSGLAATFYSITVSTDTNESSPLAKLISNLKDVKKLLHDRQKLSPEKFVANLELRQLNSHKAPYEPLSTTEHFFPGTFYLEKIDQLHRRSYQRIPVATNGHI